MEKLVFIPIKEEETFGLAFEKEVSKIFSKGDNVAVKLHMGEEGNKNYLKPDFVKRAIAVLKSLGTLPFLFDSPTMYHGARYSVKGYLKVAEKHGFTEESMGCPIIISDESVKVKMPNITANVCKEIYDADALLVLTHVKGHACSGFGASIKNLGMGGVNRETKTEIHGRPRPSFKGDCLGCGACVEICPAGVISIKDNKASFNLDYCWGCGACTNICPVTALEIKPPTFNTLLAEAGIAVAKNKKKIYCINVIEKVAKFCDCVADAGPYVVDDIGILMGRNIVAVDKASLDLINQHAGVNGDLFRQLHGVSAEGHIEEAAKASSLSMEYDLDAG